MLESGNHACAQLARDLDHALSWYDGVIVCSDHSINAQGVVEHFFTVTATEKKRACALMLSVDWRADQRAHGYQLCYMSSRGHTLALEINYKLKPLIQPRLKPVVKRNGIDFLKRASAPAVFLQICNIRSHAERVILMAESYRAASVISQGVFNFLLA